MSEIKRAVLGHVAKSTEISLTPDQLDALSPADKSALSITPTISVPLHLTHISVGDANNEPTHEDLQAVLRRFLDAAAFCEPYFVKVSEHEFHSTQKIVLTMGNKKWIPTHEELKAARDNLAVVLKAGGVLVTHYSVKFVFLEGPSFMSMTVKATQ